MVLLSDILREYGWQIGAWLVVLLLALAVWTALVFTAGRRVGQREMPQYYSDQLRKRDELIVAVRADRAQAILDAQVAAGESAEVRGRAAAFMELAR